MSLQCCLNPYGQVNWDTVEHHKANLHTHTNQSDGQLYPDTVIDLYQKSGYTILSLTDHDSRHGLNTRIHNLHHPAGNQTDRRFPDPENPALKRADRQNREPAGWEQIELTEDQLQAIAATTWPWSQWNRYQDEFAPDPETGVMPNGMLGIEGNELSNHGHIGSYYNDCATIKWNPATAPPGLPREAIGSEPESLAMVGAGNGLACLNHPSNDPRNFAHYESLFANHPHLIAMEVCQPWQHDATSLWDHLLTRFIEYRPIWGLGADDFHSIIHFGYGWNVFLIDRLNHKNVRAALENGCFYFVRANQLWHKNSGNTNPDFYRVRGKPPRINSISVDHHASLISIDASGYDTIRWISQGHTVGTGEQFSFRPAAELEGYVRAELEVTDEWGIQAWAYTNPFGFKSVP